jgi:putative membrane protein
MWVMPMLMPIVVIVVLVVCLYFLFGRGGPRPFWPEGREEETAMEILKKRYARGEITKAEFEEMKKDLFS